MRRSIASFFSAVLLLPLLLGAGCTQGPDAATAAASKRVELNVWGVVDDQEVYDKIFRDFRTQHPNVTINYQRFRLEEYENLLLNAMAEDRGPDLFLVNSTWIGKYIPKILPMPPTVKVATQHIIGTLKKEAVMQLDTIPTMSIRTYKANYPETVALDTVKNIDVGTPEQRNFQDRIVAMPVAMDTLGMFVNKDLLNAAGIATIPQTWDKFQEAIPKLVKQDTDGTFLQTGAALGTGFNVERAPDIMAALMMQNGTAMSQDDGSPSFGSIPPELQNVRNEPPALQALTFYTDFANPAKAVYTWNAQQPNSLDAFIQGRTAFFFGYSYDLPIIKARAPKLNLGIAPLPQIPGNPVRNFANYWTWTVSKKTKSPDIAWALVNFMVQPDEVSSYLTAAKHPAADKTLLQTQFEDEEIGVFASQVLTSKSWYRGKDVRAADNAFIEMAENVVNGTEDIQTALSNALSKVRQSMQ